MAEELRHWSDLTTELSGRPQPLLRLAERAIHCEDKAPTMNHGPLQRVVRRHSVFPLDILNRKTRPSMRVTTRRPFSSTPVMLPHA